MSCTRFGGVHAAAVPVNPTANFRTRDIRIPIDVVAEEARPAEFECAVKTSMGFGGHNAALVLTKSC